MDMVEPTFDATVFTKNRERLLAHDVAGEFFRAVVEQARKARLMSAEHFTVDGTLIDAWASLKSFKRKDANPKDEPPPDDPGNPTVNFHGEKRSNETHASTSDPEAKLARKGRGKEAKLSYSAHALMENRNGLLVDFRVAEANGRAEREVAVAMLDENKMRRGPATVGADKGYDTHDFVAECRAINVVPHIARIVNEHRGSAIDARTTRHPGYAISQRIRKRVEEIFGWAKTVGNFRKTRFRGRPRTQLAAYLVGAAYNLLRIARLAPAG
jgi:IS5 family transposase